MPPPDGRPDGVGRRRWLGTLLVLVLLAASLFAWVDGTRMSRDAAAGRTRRVVPASSAPPSGASQHRVVRRFRATADLDAIVNSLRPGEVAELASGVYGARGRTAQWTAAGTPRAPIVIEPMPGAQVTILGHNVILASHLWVSGLIFAGPTGPVQPRNRPDGEEFVVGIYGHDVTLSGCEVRGAAWHAGIYTVGNHVTIAHCWVHDNGARLQPEQVNLDQGIYYARGYGGRIVDNLIEHNYAYGLQIYPSARDLLVQGNVIVGNGTWSRSGRGGGVAWEGSTRNVLLVDNVLAFNDGWDIHTGGSLRGSQNVARSNLSFANTAGTWNDSEGIGMTSNTAGKNPCRGVEPAPTGDFLTAACRRLQ